MKKSLGVRDWLGQLRAAGIPAVAEAFGLIVRRGRSIAPCPSCGALRRGRHDSRGPVGIRRDSLGWRCHRCAEVGDAATLVSWCLFGRSFPPGGRWPDLRRACVDRGMLESAAVPPPRDQRPAAPPRRRPPRDELLSFWKSLVPVADVHAVAAWLDARGVDGRVIATQDLARALPARGRLPTWARYQGQSWRASAHHLIVPLFDPGGVMTSVHARSIRAIAPMSRAKGASPSGFETAGLVMANVEATRWLRGEAQLEQLDIVEGVPDFLFASTMTCGAVVGIVSGSWSNDLAARIPASAWLAIRTHDDPAGAQYASQIVRSVAPSVRITRTPA